jgi:hypothetical protein
MAACKAASAEWSGGSGVSVDTGSPWQRMEGGADEGAVRSEGESGGGCDLLLTWTARTTAMKRPTHMAVATAMIRLG